MPVRKYSVGGYEIDLTVDKTGNMLIIYTNKATGQTETVYIENPFLTYYKKDSATRLDYVT